MTRLSARQISTAINQAEIYRCTRDVTKEEAARLAAERFGWLAYLDQIVDAMQD